MKNICQIKDNMASISRIEYMKRRDLKRFLRCSTCEKVVSSCPFVDDDPIVRAYVECPECIKKGN